MWRCNHHVGLAIGAVVSNVWLLTDGSGRRFLIDSGWSGERLVLKASLWRAGVRRAGDLDGLILTHRHSDHAGNARWLRQQFGCPVFCHENDASILSGRAPAPKLARKYGTPFDRIACRLEDRYPSRSPVDEAFGNGLWRDGFHIYPAFGHTEGSSIIYHEPSRTVFTGDAILCGMPPLRVGEHFMLAMPVYSLDVENCHRMAMDFLNDLPPIETLCSGHGPFVGKQVAEKLVKFREKLLQDPPIIPEACLSV